MRRLITEYLDEFLQRGSETAYIQKRGYRTVRCSYAEVAGMAFQCARELAARDIHKGGRVLLWGENCAEWVAAFFACALRGVAAVPIDRGAQRDFAERIFQDVDAKLIIVSGELIPDISFTTAIIPLESLSATVPSSLAPQPAVAQEPDDTVEIIFTSGATSEPKGVVISHRNILASLEPLETEIAKYLKYERVVHPLRFLNLLPLSHVFGQFLGIFIPPLLGGTVYFQEALGPSDILSTIKRERISVCVTVPRLLESLKDKIERDSGNALATQLASSGKQHFLRRWWRFRSIHRRFGWKFWAFISGAAALNADTEEFWRGLGYVVIQGYGMTESTSLISVNHPFKLGRRSIGKVLPGREVKLAKDGEILVRGANIARSYWVGKELRPVAGDDGWLRTGDLGELDEQGNLYFKGRKKSVIVTAEGINVYPEDLEAALRRQPEIRDCAVVGLAVGGNAVPAAALIPADVRVSSGELERAIARANQSLAAPQNIRRWIIWPESDFPRTSTHKLRTDLIEQAVNAKHGAGNVSETASAGDASTLSDLIARIAKRHAAISAETKLEDDLNLSSIDRVELMSAVEDRYLVDLEDSTFAAAATVGDLEGLLRDHAVGNPAGTAAFPYPRWPMRRPFRWIRACIYNLVIWPATALLAQPRVIGRERLRGLFDPVLFISNHVTAIDIAFLMFALPAHYRSRLAVAMSGELLRAMRHPPHSMNPLKRWFEQLKYLLVVALFNVQPLPQLSNFRESFDHLGEAADRGYSIVIFPEGERTTSGAMNPFRSGIGLLAQRLQLPVVPMRIDGLFPLKQAHKRHAAANAITVRIGEPVRFPLHADPETSTQELQRRVAAL